MQLATSSGWQRRLSRIPRPAPDQIFLDPLANGSVHAPDRAGPGNRRFSMRQSRNLKLECGLPPLAPDLAPPLVRGVRRHVFMACAFITTRTAAVLTLPAMPSV